MDLLRGNIKHTYFKYLGAAFGSAMLASVYSLVDMAMVGQYQGPDGAAALAVVAPVWNIIYSLGLLTGIGGSVLSSTHRGQGKRRQANQAFTVALGFTVILAAASWLGLIFFEVPLLRFFGGDEALIPLARDYLYPVKFSVPFFLFTQMLAAFLRNDGRPALATGAVLSGGVFNVLGDYFFVFVLDLGIMGAGIATCLGAAISCLVMLTHFLSPRNTLRLVPVKGWIRQMGRIGVTGFSAFFADIAMGILTILFNRQIMHYLGTAALSVYPGQCEHPGAVLRVQCGTGLSAHSLPQLRGPADQTDFGCPAVCLGDGGGLWGAVGVGAGRVSHGDCPAVHGADPGGPGGSPGHFADVWAVLFAAAVQYLFCLLFPVYSSAGQCLWNLCHPRPGGQRGSHSHLAGPLGRLGHLAGDAADRAGGGAGCGGVDGPFRPAAQGGALMKKTRPEAVPPGALR